MTRDAQSIIDAITPSMTVDQIRILVNTWDIDVGGGDLLLYSGGIGDVQPDGRLQYGA